MDYYLDHQIDGEFNRFVLLLVGSQLLIEEVGVHDLVHHVVVIVIAREVCFIIIIGAGSATLMRNLAQ